MTVTIHLINHFPMPGGRNPAEPPSGIPEDGKPEVLNDPKTTTYSGRYTLAKKYEYQDP